MKSKMIISLMIIAMVAALIGGATMAWFTDSDDAGTATFTAGTVELDANFVDSVNGQIEIEGNWNPGQTVQVSLNVVNTGTKDMVFRLKPDFDITPATARAEEWTQEEIDAWSGQNITGRFTDASEIDNWGIKYIGDLANDNWENHEYYYLHVVPGTYRGATLEQRTVTLSMDVTLKGNETGNKYQGAIFTLEVDAEAVQASNDAPYEVWGVEYYRR